MRVTAGSVVFVIGLSLVSAARPAPAQPTPATCNQVVAPNVRYCFYNDTQTPMHIVVIDRDNRQGYELRVLADETGRSREFRTHRVTHLAVTSIPPALVAVNGSFFNRSVLGHELPSRVPQGLEEGEGAIPLYSVYLNGNMRVPPEHDREWIMGFAAGGPRLDLKMFRASERDRPENQPYLHYAIGSGWCVLQGNRNDNPTMNCPVRIDEDRPRSSIGYGPDRVVIISSHQELTSGQRGAQPGDLAPVFRSFGVTDAIVLDGGSSAQLYVQGVGAPGSPVNPVPPLGLGRALRGARFVANAVGLVPTQCPPTEADCLDTLDNDCDTLTDCDDPDCAGRACTYCALGTHCPAGTTCFWDTHRCVPRAAALDASVRVDAAVADATAPDVRPDAAIVMDTGRPDIASTLDAGIDAPARPDAGVDTGARFDAVDMGVDTAARPEVGVDAGTTVDVMDVPSDGVPRPPAPMLNSRIPTDVTYHRTYDFTGPDTCTRCSNHPSDPYPMCAPPGFEFDVERHATESTRSGFLSANYFCPYNASGGYYDCYKEYVCTWNPDPATGASCICPRDREVSPGMPTCRATPGIGIQLTVPPGSPGAYGYNVAVWPYEPSRPAFRVGSNVYLYAQFYLPAGQDVTARPGVDCTPSADPDRDVGGVHVPSTTGPGRWHEVLIPLMATVGDFTTIREGLQNCNGWLQCMNSGIWPPNAGDARGGSCIVSRLEFAGYRDFCDLDHYDLELVVDDCVGCTLSHDLRAGSPWTEGERGTLSGSTMTWRFRGSEVQHNCQLNRQFNVQLPSGEWMIDDRWAPVEPTYGTAILIRKRARWRYMNGSTAVSSVDVACSMTRRNHDATGRTTLGHHGQVRIAGGRVVATGMPDLPCEGP